MKQLRSFVRRHTFVLVLFFFTSSILAYAEHMVYVDQREIDTIFESDYAYVYLGNEASNLVATIQQIARLANTTDRVAALSTVDARLRQGYKTALKTVVMEALEETCVIVEKYHDKISDDVKVTALIADLENCCDMISNNKLTLYKDTRAPRPQEECGIETEEFDAEEPCCDLPRDIILRNVCIGDCEDPGMLLVAGPSTFRDDITLQPCFGNQFCIFWLEDDGDEKIRMCTSPVENEKGLLFSIDGGVTQNVRIEDNGDLSLEENLNIRDSFDSATGNVIKEGERFIHNFGTNNTFFGKESGNFTLTTASKNTGFGDDTLESLTTGDCNVAVGFQTLPFNATGDNNTAVGCQAGSLGDADNVTAVGYHALFINTTGGNTAVGARALDANFDGANNTAVGLDALGANSSGDNNTVVGYEAASASDADDVTAVGYRALFLNTAAGNTAVGARALDANFDGANNTAVGLDALGANSVGNNNTAVGYFAMSGNTGGQNTALGQNAGSSLTTGSNNICIGNGVSGVAGESNTCRIGTGLTRCFIDGIEGINVGATAEMVVINADQLGTDATTINLGTNSDTVNIATGTGAKIINLGAGADDTINVPGTLNVTILNSTTAVSSTTTNKTFIANVGGAPGSGQDSGLEVEEGGSITGFIRTNGTRDCWRVKAPANASEINLCPGGTSTFSCGLAIECPTNATLSIRSDTDDAGSNEVSQIRFLSGSAGTLQAIIDTNPTSTDFNIRAEGTNNLNLQTGGSIDRLTINNLGNIGIGQTPGSDKLEVTGDTTINGTLTVNNALIALQESAIEEGRIFTNGAGNTVNLQSGPGNSLVFQTDGANTRATISSAGNVTFNAPTSGTTLTLNGTAPFAATGITLVNSGAHPRFTMNTGNQLGGFWWSDFAALGDAMALSFNWNAHGGSNTFANAGQTSAAIVQGFDELSLRTSPSGNIVPITRLNIDAFGNTTLSGPTTVSNALSVTGTATLSGPTTVSNTLGVTGTTTISGQTNINNALNVTGNTVLNGTAQITGNAGIGLTPGPEKLAVAGNILATQKVLSQASNVGGVTLASAGSLNDVPDNSVTRIEWAVVEADGTINIKSPGIQSVTKVGLGRYVVTVSPAFSSIICANVTIDVPPGTEATNAMATASTSSSITVRTSTVVSTVTLAPAFLQPVDYKFNIMIMGHS